MLDTAIFTDLWKEWEPGWKVAVMEESQIPTETTEEWVLEFHKYDNDCF